VRRRCTLVDAVEQAVSTCKDGRDHDKHRLPQTGQLEEQKPRSARSRLTPVRLEVDSGQYNHRLNLSRRGMIDCKVRIRNGWTRCKIRRSNNSHAVLE
jgi:hypothetical protein